MAGFLYYIEGARPDVKIADLRRFGLGHAFDNDGDFTAAGVTRGPGAPGGSGDGPGIVVANISRLGERALGLYPDEQAWSAGAEPSVQIGYYTDDPPTPEDLARRRLLDGHFVKLGDGNDWLIPIARGAGDHHGNIYWYEALPKGMTLNGDGHWRRGDVVPEYATLWKIAQRWADAIFKINNPTTQDGDVVKLDLDFAENMGTSACLALSANYRVDDSEIAMLNLFSDERMAYEILNATVDMPRWEALLKTKLSRVSASGSNTADGPRAAIQATDQP